MKYDPKIHDYPNWVDDINNISNWLDGTHAKCEYRNIFCKKYYWKIKSDNPFTPESSLFHRENDKPAIIEINNNEIRLAWIQKGIWFRGTKPSEINTNGIKTTLFYTIGYNFPNEIIYENNTCIKRWYDRIPDNETILQCLNHDIKFSEQVIQFFRLGYKINNEIIKKLLSYNPSWVITLKTVLTKELEEEYSGHILAAEIGL